MISLNVPQMKHGKHSHTRMESWSKRTPGQVRRESCTVVLALPALLLCVQSSVETFNLTLCIVVTEWSCRKLCMDFCLFRSL